MGGLSRAASFPDRLPTTRFVFYGVAGLALACALVILTATVTLRRTMQADTAARAEQNMRVAWHVLQESGAAHLDNGMLYAGSTKLDGNLALVDRIQQMVGGAVTIFRGDERVATNVLDASGQRALGTRLASVEARTLVLQRGVPFRGVADVVGQSYVAAYDPIIDASGRVIGILYVGLRQSDVLAVITHLGWIVVAVACVAASLAGVGFHRFARSLGGRIAARERALAQTHAHLDTALATMANGLCLWTADNRLVLANTRLLKLLGMPAERVSSGMSFRDYLRVRFDAGNFGERDFETVYAERVALIARRQPVSHLDTSRGGRMISILHRPTPDGGWIATYEDVTEQRQAERAQAEAEANLLREREKLAEEASRAKSGFLAMMSHEIRTPMNAVLGLAGSLLDGRLPPEQHRLVQAIHDSGDILLRILNDILDFTKLEAGRMTFEDAPFSPAVLTHNTVSVLGPQAAAKGLAMDAECDSELPDGLVGDAGRIRQILLNLTSNAVKFTPSGSVTVRATCLRQEGGSATVRWTVSDTGIGIPADRIATLFGEFVQADNSITRRFGGSGLGLAISKRLVTQMGGAIGVEPRPGGGTVFHVELTLPLGARPHETASRAGDATPAFLAMLAARRDRLRILFAEDNATNQLVVRQLLKGLDIQVDVVGDGREAVEAATRFAYDVIFMDMRMPEMDGMRATRLIRQMGGKMARAPIVALTANAFAEDVKACLDAGMDQFLPKPVSKELLLNAMLKALAGPDAAPPLATGAPAHAAALDGPCPPACDPAGLAALRDDIGAEALTDMLAVFETDASLRLAAMAAHRDDADLMQREAHSLRGAAAAVCAAALAHIAGTIEARAKAGEAISECDVAAASAAFADFRCATEAIRSPALAG